MATGIISISADDHHYRVISDTLAVVGTAVLIALVVLVVLKLILRRDFAFHHLDDPDSALRPFTFVAACGVLAARFEPHRLPFWVLGGAAVLAWLALSPIAVRSMAVRGRRQLPGTARGAWLLATVATSGVAIVLADASRLSGHRVLLWVAFAAWALALIVYGLITWLIVAGMLTDSAMDRVTDRQTTDRAEPDSWILMGGLAIATLAGNHIYRALDASSPLRGGVSIATFAIRACQRTHRRAALCRGVVGAGVSAGHVLHGDRGDFHRPPAARVVDDLAGVLLDRSFNLVRRGRRGSARWIRRQAVQMAHAQ
jgi:Voltage-dependent anion channel